MAVQSVGQEQKGKTMKKTFGSLFLILALCASASAQKKSIPLVIDGDTQVVVKKLPFKITAAPGNDVYVWSFPDTVSAEEVSDGVLLITKAPKGTFRVSVVGMKVDFETKKVLKDRGVIEVVVGVAPGPTPDPDPPPPDPDPQPNPAPIPEVGFRVLIVEDPKARVKLPAEQLEVLFDKSVRDYLNSKCVQDADGKTKSWRIWPDRVDASKQAEYWQKAMKRKRDSLPWIVVSNSKSGYEGPLPKDVASTLELIKKYEPK